MYYDSLEFCISRGSDRDTYLIPELESLRGEKERDPVTFQTLSEQHGSW